MRHELWWLLMLYLQTNEDHGLTKTVKTGSKLAVIVFTIVAVAHLMRLAFGISMTISDWVVPQWISLAGVIIPGLIVWMLWWENR